MNILHFLVSSLISIDWLLNVRNMNLLVRMCHNRLYFHHRYLFWLSVFVQRCDVKPLRWGYWWWGSLLGRWWWGQVHWGRNGGLSKRNELHRSIVLRASVGRLLVVDRSWVDGDDLMVLVWSRQLRQLCRGRHWRLLLIGVGEMLEEMRSGLRVESFYVWKITGDLSSTLSKAKAELPHCIWINVGGCWHLLVLSLLKVVHCHLQDVCFLQLWILCRLKKEYQLVRMGLHWESLHFATPILNKKMII